MRKTSELREDGLFGALYRATFNHERQCHDLRAVIREYMVVAKVGHRRAWEDWFAWAAERKY